MDQIYFSENSGIAFNEKDIYVNSEKVAAEEIGETPIVEYAYKIMRVAYGKMLSKQYENIVVLTGAGTSVGIGEGTKKGKTMSQLWEVIVKEVGMPKLQIFAKKIKFDSMSKGNIDLEALLSRAILSESYISQKDVKKSINDIETIIRRECSLDLPDNAPHDIFLRKIIARKLKYPRIKIFTLNYDLLFEQAATRGGYVVIDGFSFTTPRKFSGTNFDYDIVIRNNNRALSEENFAPKVFHLYKPHGSLDWDRIINNEGEYFIKSDNPQKPVMIYPSSSKFELSYEQPYFEMISRFQQELRTKNTLLLVIGFSFYDKHIKAMIMEALNINPSITLVVISPDVHENDKFSELKDKSSSMKNVILINETFENFSKHYPYSEVYDYSSGEVLSNESI